MFLEPIVEIKASINISVASWYNGTPMPMICIVEESVFKQAQLQVSSLNYSSCSLRSDSFLGVILNIQSSSLQEEGSPVSHGNFLKFIQYSFASCFENYFYFLLIDAPTSLYSNQSGSAKISKNYHWKRPMYGGMLLLHHPLLHTNI